MLLCVILYSKSRRCSSRESDMQRQFLSAYCGSCIHAYLILAVILIIFITAVYESRMNESGKAFPDLIHAVADIHVVPCIDGGNFV